MGFSAALAYVEDYSDKVQQITIGLEQLWLSRSENGISEEGAK